MSLNNSVKRGRSDFILGAPRVHIDVRKNNETGLFEGFSYQGTVPIPGSANESEMECIRVARSAIWDTLKKGE